MSYNGSGVYTLPGAALANGDIVSATENNQFRNDVAAALNVAWTRDGQAPATANIPMGTFKFTGLGAGTGAGDSVRYEQFASPPAIGNTAANTGAFTTLTTSSTVTVNGGTANGVAYLNGSKVLTTGSALTFDGTNFATTGTASATKLIPTGGSATGNGMYLPAANTLAWSTNGAEVMRIDSSGNVGIGTTSPVSVGSATALTVYNSATPILYLQNSNSGQTSTDGFSIALVASDAYINNRESGAQIFLTSNTERMRIDSSGNVIVASGSTWATSAGGLQFAINGNDGYITTYYDAHTVTLGAGVSLKNQIKVSGSGGANNITMNVGGSERMRIDSSGNLLVGCTSAPSASVAGSAFIGESVGRKSLYLATNSTGATVDMIYLVNPNGIQGKAGTNATGSYWSTSSDYRLKENVQPMHNALDKVALLKPCTYTWKSTGQAGQGFIAHELQEVIPEAVIGEKDAVDAEGRPDYQGIDTSFLVATLTKAIQELKAELDATKAEVAALKGV